MTALCANCDGEGWVCENHPEVPWQDGEGCCGAPGMPCVCNDVEPPWHYERKDIEEKKYANALG